MLSAELLGALEYVVTALVRAQGTYKKRPDGSTRAFGGVNLVTCADLWQLHPVSGTFIASHFTVVPPGHSSKALSLFWEDGHDSIRSFWQLTELMRCDDSWYNDFLAKCRSGSLPLQQYCYFHNLPTMTSPDVNCQCNADAVKDDVIGPYRASWKKVPSRLL